MKASSIIWKLYACERGRACSTTIVSSVHRADSSCPISISGRPEHPAGVRGLLVVVVVVRRGEGRGDKGLVVCGLGLRGERWSTEWERSENQKSLQSRFQSPSSQIEPKAVFPVCSCTGHRSLLQDGKAAKAGGIQVRLGREFSELCWSEGVGDEKN